MKERGDTIIGEDAIKFGVEYRDLLSDQGVCIHVLGDVSEDEEHELLSSSTASTTSRTITTGHRSVTSG